MPISVLARRLTCRPSAAVSCANAVNCAFVRRLTLCHPSIVSASVSFPQVSCPRQAADLRHDTSVRLRRTCPVALKVADSYSMSSPLAILTASRIQRVLSRRVLSLSQCALPRSQIRPRVYCRSPWWVRPVRRSHHRSEAAQASATGRQLQVGRCQANRPERQSAVGFPRVLVHRALPLPEGCPVNDPRNRCMTCSLRVHRRRWGCAGRRCRGVSSGSPTRLPLDHSGLGKPVGRPH